MRLLDRVTGWEHGRVEAQVDVVREMLGFDPGRGVPAWLGVEYLAQAAALCFGLLSRDAGQQAHARPGMLVACRRFECSVDHFPEGATLTISAWPSSPLGHALLRFQGEIRLQAPIAAGEVSVYMGPAR